MAESLEVSEPRVSAVIPVRDGQRYLAAAIESALSQRVSPFELIVVDDGSTDRSLEIASSFGPPVRCLALTHHGIGAARNAGAAASDGDYLAFLDADDLWADGALASLLDVFSADPEIELAFGHVRQFISPDLDAAVAERLACRPGLEPGYLAGAILVRRVSFERIDGFREDLVSGEMIDWIVRARESGLRERLIAEQVLWRRIHASNHGRRRSDARSDYARVVKSALDRRRAS